MRALITGLAFVTLASNAFGQGAQWTSKSWNNPNGAAVPNEVANFINECQPRDASGIAAFISQTGLANFNVVVFCRMDKSGKSWRGFGTGPGADGLIGQLAGGVAIIGDIVDAGNRDTVIVVAPR
jgi:hypothetical protein